MKRKPVDIFVLVVAGIAGSLVLSVVYYMIFALFISSDVEKRLLAENAAYKRQIPQVEAAADLLENELEYLAVRDGNIYRSVFKAEAPRGDDLLESSKPDNSMECAALIEDNWRAIYAALEKGKADRRPIVTPLENMNYTNVGASVGNVLSPFYKVNVYHDGIDIVAPSEATVYATANGVVSKVSTSIGGKGNCVEITHEGGIVTRYAHLSAILVRKGARVKAGDRIGLIGDSGRSFSTHLHYEINDASGVLDPVYYFVGSATPETYPKMIMMSASSGQAMD